MKYFMIFNESSDYTEYMVTPNPTTPNVSYCSGDNKTYITKEIDNNDYSRRYFTIESLEDNNAVTFSVSGQTSAATYYSVDGGSTWQSFPLVKGLYTAATINSGDTVMFKCDCTCISSANKYSQFSCTKQYVVYGNIMSLTWGDNFIGKTEFKENINDIFNNLFSGSTTLKSAENLILPATTVHAWGYSCMFQKCTSLEYPPKVLPATTVASGGCQGMFYRCISLKKAPKILAKNFKNSSFKQAFCMSTTDSVQTSLEKAPVLIDNANNRETASFNELLEGNASLKYIKMLSPHVINEMLNYKFGDWVKNVGEEGLFVKNKDFVARYGDNCIPSGWTVIDQEDEGLIIDSITECTISFSNPISYMGFLETDWTSLPANTPIHLNANEYCELKGDLVPTAQGIGTFSITGQFKLRGTLLKLVSGETIANTTNAFYRLFKGCTGLTDISGLYFPTTLSSGACEEMFADCTNLTEAGTLSANTLSKDCYKGMFKGCTSLTTSPYLPARTLVSGCYDEMFSGCSSLNYIKADFTMTPGTAYTKNWVYGVAQEGFFEKFFGCSWKENGVNGMPIGWDDRESKYEKQYFTIIPKENNAVVSFKIGSAVTLDDVSYIEYSMDSGVTWTRIENSANTQVDFSSSTMSKGSKIMFRGNNRRMSRGSTYQSGHLSACTIFGCSKYFFAEGNIFSLLYNDDFADKKTFKQNDSLHDFGCLFLFQTKLQNVDNLILPATAATQNCYIDMFNGTNVTSSPVLPILVLAPDCYKRMFKGNTSIKRVVMLATNISASQCTKEWLYSAKSGGKFFKNSAATWTTTGVDGIPNGWAVELLDA